MLTKSKRNIQPDELIVNPKMFGSIVAELRLLRKEVLLLLPQDDLEDYEHEERIKKSYQRAIKQFPPILL